MIRMKTSMKYRAVIPVVFLFTFFLPVPAQTPGDSLISYLKVADSKNPVILQKYNEYQASLRRVAPAGSLQDPDLSVGVFLSPMEIISGRQVADIRLMQMFPWFGSLKAAKEEMSQMANANFEALRAARLQVSYDVRSTWYELIKTRGSIGILQENISLLHTIEKLAIARYKSGGQSDNVTVNSSGAVQENPADGERSDGQGMQSMTGNQATRIQSGSMQAMGSDQSGITGTGIADLYRIKIEINELENSIALLKDKEKTLTARFNGYLDRDPASVVALPDSITMESPYYGLTTVTDSSFKSNPMLVMLEHEKKSVEARQKMADLMGYPMTGMGLNYSVIESSSMSSSSMNGKDMIMPMVSFTLPIYRKKYKALKEEAGFQKEAVMQNYTTTGNSLQSELYEALQLYQDAGRRVELYNNQCILIRRSFNIMVKSFGSAGSSLTDLLQVRRELAGYDMKKIEAIADYNTSVAWIKKLMAIEE